MRQTFILLSVFMLTCVNTQHGIGISAGYSNNHLQTNISNRLFIENKNGNSFSTGLIFNYAYKNKIQLLTELDVLQKNYSFVRKGIYEGIFANYRNTYLQLPVIIEYKLLQKTKWALSADAGFFVSYWVFGSIKGVISNLFDSYYTIDATGLVTNYLRFSDYYKKYTFSHLNDNRFEVVPLVGITSRYLLNNRHYFCQYNILLIYHFTTKKLFCLPDYAV